MNTALSLGLEKIKKQFLVILEQNLVQMSEAVDQLHDPLPHAPSLKTICDIAHKIAGTAGTLGFTELGAQAAVTEDLIRQYGIDTPIIDPILRDELEKLLYLAAHPN
ncbi:Hpt domain-containing protein [Roseibium sp.]|uniref:Hpt domain-containing protein n=1 Tax=Roseibium sp. TaxID=1936156 RepID=UPI003A9872A5